MPHKAYFNWSGGKDSALALYYTLQNPAYRIERLLTNIASSNRRLAMHGVREVLLDQQADAIGIPIQKIALPEQPEMAEYEEGMIKTMQGLKAAAFTHVFFGDIFLDDLRSYRENMVANCGMEAVFPLWKKDTRELLHQFIDVGFKAIVICIKADVLHQSFAGRLIDKQFVNDLPPGIDAGGENGEFHSFVFDGPIFSHAVKFKKGSIFYKEFKAPESFSDRSGKDAQTSSMAFWYCDLLPVEAHGRQSTISV